MIGGILLCAGSATRMGFDKLRTPIGGRTAIERSAELLVQGGCETLVLVGNEANEADLKSLVCGVPSIVVRGGATRTESVRNGLRALLGAEIVAIHDAARCFVPADCVARSIESAKQFGSGVLALANAAAGNTIQTETLDCGGSLLTGLSPSGELSGEWGGFLSTLVAESASGLPSDDVTSSIGDGDDGVVKRSVNVSDAFGEGTLDFLLTCRGGFTFFCSSHCLSPSLFSRFFLIRDGLSLTFAGTSVGSGALTVNWEATLMADATVAADFG